ncbi:hypothetical protein, partial [Gemmiger formicilis]|uniref:hypothetical protein n=1 Tax=Gemmiger formicilis TaxID=745368 RepID=UPI001FAFA2BE
ALSTPKMVKATNKEIKIMHTKCMGPDDMISSLSGGNQLVHVGVFGALGHDQVAVTQHRDFIADFEDLVHLV